MPKITERTHEQLSQPGKRGPGRPRKLHVIQPHEPLPNEEFVVPPNVVMTPPPYSINVQPQAAIPQITMPQQPQVKPPLKVACIGTAPSSRMLAPYNDSSWTIWACSPGNMNVLPRVDAWFEIHGDLLWPEKRHYGEPYINWLRQLRIPLYMQDQRYCANAIPLPKDELVKEFGPFFFTSSFSWMMAMAMKLGAVEIALFGIDMASRDEYILQRPGAYFFFHEAAKRGCKIIAPYESDILQPPGLYGYSEVTPFGRKILARRQEIIDRIGSMKTERDKLSTNITYLEGALEDNDYMHSIWGGIQNNSGLDSSGEAVVNKLVQPQQPQTPQPPTSPTQQSA